MTPRERVVELAKSLREAAFAQDPAARAAIELLKVSLEESKESLVRASGEDMYREQGAARCMAKLLKELTAEPPKMQ